MIVSFKQTGRQPHPTFSASILTNQIASAIGRTQSNQPSIQIGDHNYFLSDSLHRDKNAKGEIITQVTDISLGNAVVGRIYPELEAKKKVLFFSFGIEYFVIELSGEQLKAYEIGLGAGQHYVCIYRADKLVAIIHKDDQVINFRDTYTIYFEDESLTEILCVFNLYFDCTRYPDHGEIAGQHEEDGGYLTTQAELNAKYDPSFIPRIKALDGITD
jgi:hypothetical protein